MRTLAGAYAPACEARGSLRFGEWGAGIAAVYGAILQEGAASGKGWSARAPPLVDEALPA
ncbi:hypothetical protein GCM10022214_66570 [Actinomadura miaoliensis]|uniref:Uncharacterized protein n=1 Tax=Actinomadura miaoliensis TaxID=430685 RepID=A0ABP7WR06_9ACTN